MSFLTLKEFVDFFTEAVHPEIDAIIKAPQGRVSKARLIAKKMSDLVARGERTGVEDKMPKGSSRAYVQESDQTPIIIDGQKSKMMTGHKVVIPAALDIHHNAAKYDGLSLGAMQNQAENGDWFINNYRILKNIGDTGHSQHNFETNEDNGIFPPLLDHDDEGHSWSHIGHVDSIRKSEFRTLTASKDHPRGISHEEFVSALVRDWHKIHGRYWGGDSEHERRMDHVQNHPLVQKFLSHQHDYHAPPHDYGQLGNMGKWWHPTDQKYHIVARDHGFSNDVMKAYGDAREKQRRNYERRY